jgi:hypothetical protein
MSLERWRQKEPAPFMVNWGKAGIHRYTITDWSDGQWQQMERPGTNP